MVNRAKWRESLTLLRSICILEAVAHPPVNTPSRTLPESEGVSFFRCVCLGFGRFALDDGSLAKSSGLLRCVCFFLEQRLI